MRTLRLVLLSALPFLAPAPAFAAPVLDQSYEAATASVGTFSGITRAQTFTVGLDGRLVRVDLVLGRSATDPHVLMQLDVRGTTIDGVPDGPALAEATPLSTSAVAQGSSWITFDLPGDGLAVTAGEVLAIGFTVPLTFPDDVFWVGSPGSDGYAGGDSYIDSGSGFVLQGGGFDGSFRTWVELPEPGGLAGGAGALGALAWLAARRGRAGARA